MFVHHARGPLSLITTDFRYLTPIRPLKERECFCNEPLNRPTSLAKAVPQYLFSCFPPALQRPVLPLQRARDISPLEFIMASVRFLCVSMSMIAKFRNMPHQFYRTVICLSAEVPSRDLQRQNKVLESGLQSDPEAWALLATPCFSS